MVNTTNTTNKTTGKGKGKKTTNVSVTVPTNTTNTTTTGNTTTTTTTGNTTTTTTTVNTTNTVSKLTMVNCKGETVEYKPISSRALKANITAYSDPQRTQVIATFDTFAQAKIWLGVTNVGTSLERASETGKPSRGYWWKVVM